MATHGNWTVLIEAKEIMKQLNTIFQEQTLQVLKERLLVLF